MTFGFFEHSGLEERATSFAIAELKVLEGCVDPEAGQRDARNLRCCAAECEIGSARETIDQLRHCHRDEHVLERHHVGEEARTTAWVAAS